MSLSFLTITVLGLAAIAAAGDTLPWNVPRVLEPVISTSSFKAAYEIGTWLNPFYLRGDFDGDGLPDYALLVIHRGDGKKGIVVWLSSRAKSGLAVVGAGTEFGAGGGHSDNWDFFDAWQVYEKRTAGQVAGQGQRPKGEAIWLEKSESDGALLFWEGKRFDCTRRPMKPCVAPRVRIDPWRPARNPHGFR